MMSSRTRPHRHDGFVLPYVLVTIAILAIASLIAIQRIENTTRLISAIQEETNTEWALMSAEAEAIFAVLTASPYSGGLDLKNTGDVGGFFGVSEEDKEEPELWSAAGGVRRSDTAYGPVRVHYRDVAGLIPLNTASLAVIEKLMIKFGVRTETARTMAATLADYVDEDNRRQFRGGERASYRLHNLPSPTNSPVRSYEELGAVLKWAAPLKRLDMARLKEWTTLYPTQHIIKLDFADPELVQSLGLRKNVALDGSLLDEIQIALANDAFPSSQMRLTFSYRDRNGRITRRAIEIDRRVNTVVKPFRKFCIYDRVMLEDALATDFEPVSELKNVVFSPSYNAQ